MACLLYRTFTAMKLINGKVAVVGAHFCRLATPFWRDGRPPDDVNASEDEDAEFKCNVNGFPRPTITWMINGRPIGTQSCHLCA